MVARSINFTILGCYALTILQACVNIQKHYIQQLLQGSSYPHKNIAVFKATLVTLKISDQSLHSHAKGLLVASKTSLGICLVRHIIVLN